MPKESRKPIEKDESFSLEINLEQEHSRGALATRQQIESYLERKAAVTETDHQAFQDYLNQKAQAVASAQRRGPLQRQGAAAVEAQSP